MFGSELVCGGDEGLVVGCLYTFEDWALALGSKVKGDLDIMASVCCFNHCFGFVFLVSFERVFGYQLNLEVIDFIINTFLVAVLFIPHVLGLSEIKREYELHIFN